MASPLHQVEYVDNQTAQSNFQTQYNLEDPSNAVASYMRSLHQYTKSQMNSVVRAPKRRTDASNKGVSQMASLSPETSVESTDSRP